MTQSRSVRRRILLAQLLPLLPAVVVGLVCVAGLVRMTWVVHEARTAGTRRIEVIGEAIDLFREEVVLLSRYHETGQAALVADARDRSRRVQASIAELSSPALHSLLARGEVIDDIPLLVADYEQLAGLTGPAGDPAEADRAARHALRAMQSRQDQFREEVRTDLQTVAATGQVTAVGVVVLVGVFLVTGTAGALGLSRALVRDLEVLERGTNALAAGEFEHRIRLPSRKGPAGPRDDEFARLARAFNRMAERIAAMDRAREDFFANLSHDLKTPLTSLLEAVDLLDEEVAGPLNPDQRRLVRVARESGTRLRSLVRNMLDISRMRAADPELAPGDVIHVVDSAIAELSLLAERRQVTLERRGDPVVPEVLANKGMLRQVVYNLLDNALKHAPPGSVIAVEVMTRGGPRGVPVVETAVVDEGPGIPAEYRERVFERFFQVPGERSGTGLGLHIVRRIVESHGGAVSVGAGPTGGARVAFALPALVTGQIDPPEEIRALRADRGGGRGAP